MVDGVGTTHHVKIGDYHFLMRPYGYSKKAAPLFGARITSGDPDYNNLSIWQHWAQSCWVGGIDADQWVDDAMYDEAVGVDTTIHERINLSRDLSLATAGALDSGTVASDTPRRFIIYRNSNLVSNTAKLYCLSLPRTAASSKLWSWNGTTWALVKTFTSLKARCLVIFAGKLIVGFSDGTFQHCTDPAGSWTSVDPPSGVTQGLTGLASYNQKLYCAYENKIYRRSTDLAVDGSTVFYEAANADQIVDMVPHLGFLYMLSSNARVYRTDGNNTFDIWGWDGNTMGVSMVSYDGRLFLATYEYTDNADVGFGVLYQFSGAAVTQLKKYGSVGKATTVGRMMVYDRRLWYGASGLWGMNKNAAGTDLGGFGVATYDSMEDSHSIWATNKDTTTYADSTGVGQDWHVDDVIFFNGKMHAAVRKHGNFVSDISFRDYLRARAKYDTTATTATGSSNQGFLISSDYDAGTVGLQKLWRDIVVHCDLATTGVTVGVDYSLDGGTTWVAAGTVSKTLTGTVSRTSGQTTLTGTGTKFLNELTPGEQITVGADTRTVLSITSDTALTVSAAWGSSGSGATLISAATRFARRLTLENVRGNRFKYRLRLSTNNTDNSPVVRGVVVSYLPLPEPNWQWDMTLICSNRQELLDKSVVNVDGKARMEYLENLYRTQSLFQYTDLDGVVWTIGSGKGCLMLDIQRNTAVTGDPVAEAPLEGDVRVTILEAVESY